MADIIRINCCGTRQVPDNWKAPLYSGISRLYYIHGGKGGFTVKGKQHSFEKGKLYFFPYNVQYSLFSDSLDKVDHTYADFELVPPVICDSVICCDIKNMPAAKQTLDLFIEFGRLCSKEKMQAKGKSTLHRLYLSALIYLSELCVSASEGAYTVKDKVVIAALEEMHANMDKEIKVEQLAAKAYLTPDSFIRRFRSCLGITPYAYLKNLRLRNARYMLDEGKRLSEVAASVGYSDVSSLLHAINNMEK